MTGLALLLGLAREAALFFGRVAAALSAWLLVWLTGNLVADVMGWR